MGLEWGLHMKTEGGPTCLILWGGMERMYTHTRLPVLQTVVEVASFVVKKFPALLALTCVAAVIAEPLTFLALQFTGNFAELASLFSAGVASNSIIASLAESWRGLLIVLLGVTLFLALIAGRHPARDDSTRIHALDPKAGRRIFLP